MISPHSISLLLIVASALASCRPVEGKPETDDRSTRAAIVDAMARYMVAARTVSPDSMAAFFAPQGVLFEPGINPIESPDSIRAFIASFPGVRVDSATAVPDTVEVYGNTAFVWGSYFERLAFPGQPLSEQNGHFVIQWVQQPDGRWLIQRYYRIPLPGTRLGAIVQ